MNIITGKWKGRKLKSLDTQATRPTLARVKESLFCVIDEKIAGSVCLDLFAGSGAMGIECLSRGAQFCYFVDNNKIAKNVINENLKGETDQTKIIIDDYLRAIDMVDKKVDLVFLDPPYESGFYIKAIEKLIKTDKLNDKALICLERLSKNNLLNLPEGCILVKSKNYGDITVDFIIWGQNGR